MRLRGVQHPPEADIQNIRDLLRGYGSEGSLVKELIQNAEDAGAEHLDLIFVAGVPDAAHPLLRGPGLCAVNDGKFEPAHREAIFRLGLGTKGADPRAIGRFGKGLKSVFALCEAFFVAARADKSSGWSSNEEVCEFFNPWNGWRHADWDEAFDSESGAVFSHVAREVAAFGLDCPHWLAFWLPLRHPDQRSDSKGTVAWIHEGSRNMLPGEDSALGTTLDAEFRKLAPSLVTLRSLQRIRLIDASAGASKTTEWSLAPKSSRSSEPGAIRQAEHLTGSILLADSTGLQVEMKYAGYAGTLSESHVAEARAKHGWPTIVDISETGSSADQKAKGEPHYATILTTQPSETGQLEVRWSVFFPVGEQPDGERVIALPGLKQAITLNLHGFFFLDTERRRVDGLQQHFAESNHACLDWNQIIATKGTLAHVPQALATFSASEKLNVSGCAEMAKAIRQTWIWSRFDAAICQDRTWRPRWRAGVESWECLPIQTPVLAIPTISNVRDLVASVPALTAISETQTLAVRGADGSLPGLHNGKSSDWPEELVLQLFKDVQLGATGNDKSAAWINQFLDRLYEANSLTPAIHEQISTLPLLPVSDVRTKAIRRVGARDWDAMVQGGRLLAPPNAGEQWFHLLCDGLPDWSCLVAHVSGLPRWFTGMQPSSCNGITSAAVVLFQSKLGPFPARVKLFEALASLAPLDTEVRLAMRFLMHGSAPHARDGDNLLFMPSTQPGQFIWSRLIEQLLKHEGGENSWRLLHQAWATVLSPHIQQELTVSTIDEHGAWEELMTGQIDFDALEFPIDEWSSADVSALLQGLFQAGHTREEESRALLRKMRLHTLRGHPMDRVSVADAEGQLDKLFVLNTPNFETTIPPELMPLWGSFLSETRIVECLPQNSLASTVQKQLFKRTDEDGGDYYATLDWNHVVRRCLESADPRQWASLIMEAISHGDQAVRRLGQKLKGAEWIPLSLGGCIAPDSILLIEGMEEDLHRLLDPVADGLAGTLALPEWVVQHDGFSTLQKYFPGTDEALELLGLWLEDKSDWHLGLTDTSLPEDLNKLLITLEALEDLRGASLLAKLWRLPNHGPNQEWETLLQETIWKSLLKRFPYEQSGVARLERVLLRLANTASRSAFDAYLRQAVADSVAFRLLPRLTLVNQRGQWIPARQLIWPSANLDPAAQLCHEQAEILSPIHIELIRAGAAPGTTHPAQAQLHGNQLDQEPDFDSQVTTLAYYLQPFRNGNVGDILPAALVAVLGGYPRMLALLRELLQTDLGQQPEDFIALLLGEKRERLIDAARTERFLIEIVRGGSTTARTITGNTVEVELTAGINTLHVGDPSDLWSRYFYHYRQETACHLLRLRWIEKPDELVDPVGVFASTIGTILLKAHCNDNAEICPQNLKEVLGDVADAGQADLRRSQLYLLDMAEARLKELAVRDVPQFETVLGKFNEARQARVDAELMKSQAPARAKQKLEMAGTLIDEAKRDLVGLLQAPQEELTRRTLVAAVRSKMTLLQYSLESVALELFQNADDAVAEWGEMKKTLLPNEDQFFLHLDAGQRRLEVVHWGRPINRHAFPGYLQGLKHGYDQDLQKMLTLNFSDKGVGSNDQPAMVTGRFGLGFKTVFFVSDQPEIISGRLAFEIRGGFFPVPLPPEQATELRNRAETLGDPGLVPTAIRLKWAEGTEAEGLSRAFHEFARVAPLLAVFSRRIRTLVLNRSGEVTILANTEANLTTTGRLTHVQVGNMAFLCFRCRIRTDQRPATVLLQLDADGIVPLGDKLPKLWITTPTAEHSNLRWALNAPFKPDAARQRLATRNPSNRHIAEEVAHAWGNALLELFDETDVRWDQFARKLNLHSAARFDSWWLQIWTEMTRDLPVLQWEHLQHGGQILGWTAWSKSCGAARRLVEERSAIPTKLPGAYAKMVKSADVHFSVAGLLVDTANGCLAQVAEWASVQAVFPPGHTVDADVARFLKHADCAQSLDGDLTLQKALAAELSDQHHVSHLIGDRIGQMFMKCESLFESFSPYAAEVQPLLVWLKEAKMLASDGNYYPAPQLLCGRPLHGLIEKDEALRAAFAPQCAVLSSGYSETALGFFIKARGALAANATTLASWANAASPEQLPAVFHYLIIGDLGQQLADQLARPWLEKERSTSAFRDLSTEHQSELERKFFRGQIWTHQAFTTLPIIQEKQVTQIMPAEDAFRLVSEWWEREQVKWVAIYQQKTYPSGFPGKLPWAGEDDWDVAAQPSAQSRWLILFIHAALVPLGFNKIGRDQNFTQFLVSKNWLDVLAKVSDEPDALLAALDKYLNGAIQNTQFHFQMRQFIAFYAVARNLESFLHSLRAAEDSTQPESFNLVFSPNANPGLSGTGITAPPLRGMLGMGTCQLLRELYRLKRLKNHNGYRFAFTPIRKVRRLCTQLFGIQEGLSGASASEAIFTELNEMGSSLGLDPTFSHCFDLPLQILAENKELRTTVLRQDFEAEAMDSPELDAAPQDFIPQRA